MSRFLDYIKRDHAAASGGAQFPTELEQQLTQALAEKERQWFAAVDASAAGLIKAALSDTVTPTELRVMVEDVASKIAEGVTIVDVKAIENALAEAMQLGNILGRIQKRIQLGLKIKAL